MIFRFGPYELDEAGRELRRNGELVETEPMACELLLYLLQNRDRAVSKDELQTRVWPRSTVTEASLTRCVMKARRAVGDDADQQSVIRTLHSHGYRFVARIDEASEPATSGPLEDFSQTLTMAAQRIRKPRSKHYLFAAAVLLFLLIGAGLLMLRDPPPHLTSGVVAVLPIDNRVDDEDLDWVRGGLMSLLTRMLEDAGIDVAPERTVLHIVGDSDVGGPPGDQQLARIRLGAGADVVLNTTLDLAGGLYRLAALVTYGDGRRTRRVIVGDSPAELAADMARVIAGIVAGDGVETTGRFAKASADPLVNEMYARALDLELQGRYEDARTIFQLAANEEPDLFFLRYEIALCTSDLRQWESAEAQFQALYEEALAGDDPRALLVTLNSHGVMDLNRNSLDAAEPKLREALEIARNDRFADERAAVHTNLALVAGRRGDIEGAISLHQQAMLDYQEIGDVHGEISAMTALTAAYREKGDLTRARLNADETRERAAALGDDLARADAFMQSAYVDNDIGLHEAARANLISALGIFKKLGDPVGVRDANKGIALTALALGDTAEALRIAQLSLETAVAAESPADQARARWLLGRIAQAGGNPSDGITHYTATLVYARDHANQSLLVDAATSLAQLYLDNGDVDAAEERIDEIREVAASQRDFLRIDARLAMARNDRTTALAIMSKLRTLAGEAWQPADEALIRELEKTGP